MYNIKQAASLLGVCELTIRRHIYKNTIKAVRYGKQWRISPEEIAKIKKRGFSLNLEDKEGCK